MEKLDLKAAMAHEDFKHVSNARKLADKIGELTSKRPRDVTIWGWINAGRKPVKQEWINALAEIFEVKFGEQFFLPEKEE